MQEPHTLDRQSRALLALPCNRHPSSPSYTATSSWSVIAGGASVVPATCQLPRTPIKSRMCLWHASCGIRHASWGICLRHCMEEICP